MLPILLPLAAAVLSFLLRRAAAFITSATALGILLAVGGLIWQVWHRGTQRHSIGGWGAPLGIELYADGLTAVMLLMSALVGAFISIYALGYFKAANEQGFFYPLWLFLWAALNALFLSADIFNHYVTLELIGLSSVALITLGGARAALTAGTRYLLVTLLGSLFFLLGVALLYTAFGALSLKGLSASLTPSPIVRAAITVITAGLLLKTALFPLHFWLPPAHANAPTPVSAALSALVVKASFYLLLRLWFDVFPAALAPAAGQLLGALGVVAILWGSLLALRQERLKLLVAYSTVAQVGYLFLLFPLGVRTAWSGGVFHALAHGCAKAAMFMAAGNMMQALGHDRIDGLRGVSRQAPLSVFAFALAGVTLMGLPPTSGFVAKWLLLTAALRTGEWWWAVAMALGGLLAAGYVFRVLRQMFLPQIENARPFSVPRRMEFAALGLVLTALLLGFVSLPIWKLLEAGAPLPLEITKGVAR